MTQVTTSALLWGCGDVLAQRVGRIDKDQPLDKRRLALTAGFGAGFMGPCGHYCECCCGVGLGWCVIQPTPPRYDLGSKSPPPADQDSHAQHVCANSIIGELSGGDFRIALFEQTFGATFG